MLDISLLRRDLDAVVARLQTRKNPQPFLDVDRFKTLEAELSAVKASRDGYMQENAQLKKQVAMQRKQLDKVAA